MPLSKARDRERKQQSRAKSRLDKHFVPPVEIKPVQPKPVGVPSHETWHTPSIPVPDIDADGNAIPNLT